MKLLSHVGADPDLALAWLTYYTSIGVTGFHLILHGESGSGAHPIREYSDRFPISIEDTYSSPFDIDEKAARLNACIRRWQGEWLLLVDSDEFVELPYRSLRATVAAMRLFRANTLAAPLLQRVAEDGSLPGEAQVRDPWAEFPLCVPTLCAQLGTNATLRKYPLVFCRSYTRLREGGNHVPSNLEETREAPMTGVTHHFKWRRTALPKISERAHSAHRYRGESIAYLRYFEEHGMVLPLEGAFPYSRAALFRMGFLRRATPAGSASWVATRLNRRLQLMMGR